MYARTRTKYEHETFSQNVFTKDERGYEKEEIKMNLMEKHYKLEFSIILLLIILVLFLYSN